MITKNKDSAVKSIGDIRRATRRQYSAEEKIRIVLECLRGEFSIAELCRVEIIHNTNCDWHDGQVFNAITEKKFIILTLQPAPPVKLAFPAPFQCTLVAIIAEHR